MITDHSPDFSPSSDDATVQTFWRVLRALGSSIEIWRDEDREATTAD